MVGDNGAGLQPELGDEAVGLGSRVGEPKAEGGALRGHQSHFADQPGWPVFSGPQTHCRSWSWVNTRPAWTEGALGAFLRRKKAHLGAPKAITATAHKLARLIYTMLRYGQEYVDAGAEYYESQYQQRALRAAKRRAAHLGYQMVPMSDAGDRTTYAPPGAPTAA